MAIEVIVWVDFEQPAPALNFPGVHNKFLSQIPGVNACRLCSWTNDLVQCDLCLLPPWWNYG